MQYRLISLIAALAVAGAAVAADEAATHASWQEHTVKFHYTGFTTHYTCDGLESKVRTILVYLGARKDARVIASGCARGPNEPSPYAWVEAKFHTLAATDKGAGDGVVKANWSAFELSPRRPTDMGDGECELMEQMKPLITGNFALRDVDYRTSCVPHQISIADYSVRGKVLRLAQATK